MSARITKEVDVKVKVRYETEHSNPSLEQYVFSYHIQIFNHSSEAVQLLSRHWYIFDSNGEYKEVKGEGVVGQQPIILPSQSHEYRSYSNLKTDIGMMWGTYLMKKVNSNKLFEAKIPEFQLISPSRLN